jgi:hypothetical protein
MKSLRDEIRRRMKYACGMLQAGHPHPILVILTLLLFTFNLKGNIALKNGARFVQYGGFAAGGDYNVNFLLINY